MNRSEGQHWDARPHWGNLEANLIFLRETELLAKPRRILDIGSGKGNLVRQLLEDNHDVVGIDLDPSLVTEGRGLFGRLPAFVAAGDALPFLDCSFDIVLSFDVFEHIPDSDLHLTEVRRVLKRDGYYLLQTPNKWPNMIFETIRFSIVFGIRNAFKFLEPPYHCSLHSYWQILKRFKRNGFEAQFFDIPTVNDFFKSKIVKFLGKPGLFALRIVNPDQFPLSLRTNFFLQAKKVGMEPDRRVSESGD